MTSTDADLQAKIESLYELSERGLAEDAIQAEEVFSQLRERLTRGRVRAAEPGPDGWIVNHWVKKGILLGFRLGSTVDFSAGHSFLDKHTLPLREFTLDDKVRVVPGGSSVRHGAYLGRDVVCMPPMYVNIGAWVGDGSMIDSHALVGSCAQIGLRVHVSAGAQIGGVLEPVGALPVIVEDDVLIGGNCGIYEGTIIRREAVLAAGTILTGSTPVYDLVNNERLNRADGRVAIPPRAVVVPGSRPASGLMAEQDGIHVNTPVIVKYRDPGTSAAVALESALRG